MDNQLPDVDALIRLAKDDPDGLERLRERLSNQLIENAPKEAQKRLYGLQFQINMERRRAHNPLHSCIKISEMMMESYQSLQEALAELAELSHVKSNRNQLNKSSHFACKTCRSAEVIDFNRIVEKV